MSPLLGDRDGTTGDSLVNNLSNFIFPGAIRDLRRSIPCNRDRPWDTIPRRGPVEKSASSFVLGDRVDLARAFSHSSAEDDRRRSFFNPSLEGGLLLLRLG